MLDENLPTYRSRASAENPLSTILLFTQHGNEAAPWYVYRRLDPALPVARDKYALGLADPYNQEIVFGEVLVEPEWSHPTLSAAEVRAQAHNDAPCVLATALVPDTFSVQLYNPDQKFNVRLLEGRWGKADAWEFEMPVQSFKWPSASELDRQQDAPAELKQHIIFRWKKDGLLSKDMTCYMTGKSMDGKKSKEPDITIALFKAARESRLTIYEPNWQRVGMDDKKGLEIMLLLSSEVIRDLYLTVRTDVFNVSGAPVTMNGSRRKNLGLVGGAPPTSPTSTAPTSMSGALQDRPPASASSKGTDKGTNKSSDRVTDKIASAHARPSRPAGDAAGPPVIGDTHTRRREEQERVNMLEQGERDRADREEQERIRKMLEQEEREQKHIEKMLEQDKRERQKREAKVARETERLRRLYGTEGQELPSSTHVRPAPSNHPLSLQKKDVRFVTSPVSSSHRSSQKRPQSAALTVSAGVGSQHGSGRGNGRGGQGAVAPLAADPGQKPVAAIGTFLTSLAKTVDEERKKMAKKKSAYW